MKECMTDNVVIKLIAIVAKKSVKMVNVSANANTNKNKLYKI